MKSADDIMKSSDEVCATCGVAGVDNVKLKNCACNLVKYCSDECQVNHREQHKEECIERKAELRDKELFTPNDISNKGECPICCLPLPIDESKSTMMRCCCKHICSGCFYANKKREREGGLEPRCVYCREPLPESDEEGDKRIMKRIKKYNDPVAMRSMGKTHHKEGEDEKSLEYWTKAAELGDMEAHACLGTSYYFGEGIEKDEKKAVYHWEQAAIGGQPHARALLANHEKMNGRMEKAAKHFIIAANLGHDDSLQEVKRLFMQGIVSKEEYAAALRAHQAAVDATKSAERATADFLWENGYV
jgi:hypothetical protein